MKFAVDEVFAVVELQFLSTLQQVTWHCAYAPPGRAAILWKPLPWHLRSSPSVRDNVAQRFGPIVLLTDV